MLYTNELKNKTAERLKELRAEKGLTFYALQKAINERYGSGDKNIITNTTLKYLESTDPSDKNYKKGQGVKVETLLMLADFYGVSVQYLVGTSDTRASTDDMETAVKVTGLSEKSIKALNMFPSELLVESGSVSMVLAKMERLKTVKIVNDILENGTGFFTSIAHLLYSDDLDIHESDKWTVDGAKFEFPMIPELKFYGYMENVKDHIWTLRRILKEKGKEK